MNPIDWRRVRGHNAAETGLLHDPRPSQGRLLTMQIHFSKLSYLHQNSPPIARSYDSFGRSDGVAHHWPGHFRRTCWCLGLTICVRCQMHPQNEDMLGSKRMRPAPGNAFLIKVAPTARSDQYVCASQFRLIHSTHTLAYSFIVQTPMARFRLRSWFKSRPGKHCC